MTPWPQVLKQEMSGSWPQIRAELCKPRSKAWEGRESDLHSLPSDISSAPGAELLTEAVAKMSHRVPVSGMVLWGWDPFTRRGREKRMKCPLVRTPAAPCCCNEHNLAPPPPQTPSPPHWVKAGTLDEWVDGISLISFDWQETGTRELVSWHRSRLMDSKTESGSHLWGPFLCLPISASSQNRI